MESIGKKPDDEFHSFKDIDFLKEAVLKLQEYSAETSGEYGNIVSDMIFSIETQYQTYCGLDENDWGKAS